MSSDASNAVPKGAAAPTIISKVFKRGYKRTPTTRCQSLNAIRSRILSKPLTLVVLLMRFLATLKICSKVYNRVHSCYHSVGYSVIWQAFTTVGGEKYHIIFED